MFLNVLTKTRYFTKTRLG